MSLGDKRNLAGLSIFVNSPRQSLPRRASARQRDGGRRSLGRGLGRAGQSHENEAETRFSIAWFEFIVTKSELFVTSATKLFC